VGLSAKETVHVCLSVCSMQKDMHVARDSLALSLSLVQSPSRAPYLSLLLALIACRFPYSVSLALAIFVSPSLARWHDLPVSLSFSLPPPSRFEYTHKHRSVSWQGATNTINWSQVCTEIKQNPNWLPFVCIILISTYTQT